MFSLRAVVVVDRVTAFADDNFIFLYFISKRVPTLAQVSLQITVLAEFCDYCYVAKRSI